MLVAAANLANPIFDSKKCKEMATADDPWARKFLENNSAGFGPYRLEQLVRGQQAVFKAARTTTGQAVHRDRHLPRGADLGDAAPRCCRAAPSTSPSSCSRSKYEAARPEGRRRRRVDSSYMLWIELNAKIAPFDNLKVRQAMNFAFPQERSSRRSSRALPSR